MAFFNKIFGYRWSLYIVLNGDQIAFAMHEHSVMRIVGYVMNYFANGAKPISPWSLVLNFNHKHKTIKLDSRHFTQDGESVTSLLINEIEAIDPSWKVKGSEPIFEETVSKKRLKISSHEPGKMDIAEMIKNLDKPPEVTFFTVMDRVFGK